MGDVVCVVVGVVVVVSVVVGEVVCVVEVVGASIVVMACITLTVMKQINANRMEHAAQAEPKEIA